MKPRSSAHHPGTPGWLWLPVVLGIGFLLLPIVGLAARVDVSTLWEVVSARESRLAMGISLLTSAISAVCALLIGFPLGYVLATRDFPGRRFLRTLILLPLVLPPVVSGLALLYTFGRSAAIGSALEAAGLGLAYTTAAVVFAQIFVSLPFMVMSVETAVASRGRGYELAAAELGARPNRIFFSITIPLLWQGIVTGAVLCFARSLGEFGATLTFAGSLSGVTRTMPTQIYLIRESDPRSAIALSLLLVVVALVIIVIAYRSPHAPRLTRRPLDIPAGDAGPTEAPVPGDPREAAADDGSPAGEIELEAVLAARGIDIALSTAEGTTAIIGRNGAGKSTLFEIMTGALRPDRGRLRIGERRIFDLDAGDWPPTHERGIVHLAQNPLLFPHMSVLGNAAFGLRAHGRTATTARQEAQTMLDRLGVGHLAHRRPDAVSGGQAARIALARALVVDPRLLLLDEPLAALDVDIKEETRRVLRTVLEGRSALLITHDVDDVTALASTVVLIAGGAAVQVAAVGEVDAGSGGDEFLAGFCAGDRSGILCGESQ